MPRSRFRPLLPALALGVTLVLGFASAAAAGGDRSAFRASPCAMRLRTWLPPGAARGLRRRLLLVVALAQPIAWLAQAVLPGTAGYGTALTRSLAISLCTWAAVDLGRFLLRGKLGAAPPHYWPPPRGKALLLGLGLPARVGGGASAVPGNEVAVCEGSTDEVAAALISRKMFGYPHAPQRPKDLRSASCWTSSFRSLLGQMGV